MSILFFFAFLFSRYFWGFYACVTVLFLVAVISLPPLFFFYVVFYSLYRCIGTIFNASKFSSSFSCHMQSLCVIPGMPKASSLVFLFFGPFVEILPGSTLRMVLSILRVGQSRYLSLSWDFCYVVWVRVIFSFSWGILFLFFSFITICLIVSTFNILKYLSVFVSPSVFFFLIW